MGTTQITIKSVGHPMLEYDAANLARDLRSELDLGIKLTRWKQTCLCRYLVMLHGIRRRRSAA